MSYDSVILSDSPVRYYKLNETSGTSAADSSGTGAAAATIVNGPTLGVAGLLTGESETAIALNGSTQYITVPRAADIDVSSYTIECWVKIASGATADAIVMRDDSAFDLWGLRSVSSHAWFGCTQSGYAQSSSPNIKDNTPHHLVGVRDNSTGKFSVYVDGNLVGGPTAFTVPTTSSIGFWIGRRGDGSLSSAMTVEKVAFYPTALSGTRIAAHFAAASVTTTTATTAMSAQASLGDAGVDTTSQAGALSAQASLAAAPSVTESPASAMSAQASLSAAAIVGTVVGMSAAASLADGPAVEHSPADAMSAQASLGDTGVVTESVATAMSAQAGLVAAPTVQQSVTDAMSAQGGLAAAPTLTLPGVTGMSAQASLGADGEVVSTETTMAFTFGALDLEIDTTPHDVTSTMAFTFGGLELAMTSGPPAMALYDEHNNWLANLPKAIIGNWMTELSAPGALTCSLPMDDAATALATKKRILKVFWRGRARQAARIDGSSIQVAKDGRRWRQFNDRPGALDMLNDVAVFPEVELSRASSSQRTCGFMSRRGPWIDSGNWTPGIGYRFTDETDYKRGRPIGLSFPNPFWISKHGPHVTRPVGSAEYLRKEFTTTAVDVPYQILTTGDNYLWVWLDGEPIVTPDTIGAASYHALAQLKGTLAPGRHVLAAKIVNSPGGKYYNPVAFIFTMQQVQPNGDVVIGPPMLNSDLSWSVSDVHPGFRGGDVIVTLFKEGVDRAAAAGQWFQAVSTIKLGFDHTRDSLGDPWEDDPTEHTVDVGSTVLATIQQVAEKDLDVVLDPGPMVLNAYNRLGEDLSGSVFLNVGSGVTGSLLAHMIDRVEARDNTALIQLSDGRWMIEQDADSVADIGRVEVGLSLGSTSDNDTAAGVAQTHFAESANTTYTFTTTVTDLDGPQPLTDFNLGDSISVTDETATGYFKTRVMAMTFKPNGRRVSIDVELALDPT